MAAEAVLEYLRDTNRPYSANDIVTNLHNEYGKTAVQKALDQLTEEGSIREKIYGKQKVYSIIQPDADHSQESELKTLEAEVSKAVENFQFVEQDLKSCEAQLQELLSAPTTEDATKNEEELEKSVEKLQTKLEDLSKNAVKVSPKKRDKLKAEREKYVKEYRKRKRICMDMMDAILEGYPKSKKCLMDELGIETDEAVNMRPLV